MAARNTYLLLLCLLVTPKDVQPNNPETNQKQSLTNNIPPAIITNNELLTAIFPFELEKTTSVPLFSGAAFDTKPITAMYTNTKVDGHALKLILDSGLAGSIITKQLMDQLEVNGIIILIKVLVMKATQYQALIGNNWLSKTHAMLNWNTQKLQLSQNGQYTHVPAMCGHFKPIIMSSAPLIEFEEKKEKPIWKVYQVSWTNKDHNELLLILSWDNNNKGKQKKELIWNNNQAWETDNDQDKSTNWEWKETDKRKGKEKEKETTLISSTYSSYAYTSLQPSNYHRPKLECVDCGKKLLLMDACCGNDKEYSMATKFYCCPCIIECFG
ncbi:hypothetical protein G9A89_008308 [Geosiphon pyriformis]|nr:hypothetical protein G9A89_008308 [Geosiphon pyriformis]